MSVLIAELWAKDSFKLVRFEDWDDGFSCWPVPAARPDQCQVPGTWACLVGEHCFRDGLEWSLRNSMTFWEGEQYPPRTRIYECLMEISKKQDFPPLGPGPQRGPGGCSGGVFLLSSLVLSCILVLGEAMLIAYGDQFRSRCILQTPLLLLPCICLVQVDSSVSSIHMIMHGKLWGGIADIVWRTDELLKFWGLHPRTKSGGPVVTQRAPPPVPVVAADVGPGSLSLQLWRELAQFAPRMQKMLNSAMASIGFNHIQQCTEWVNIEGHNFALLDVCQRIPEDCAALLE